MNKLLFLTCTAILFAAAISAEPCTIAKPDCPMPEEDDESLIILPVPDNCHQYVMCNWGHATVKTCPNNLVFNHELKVCDYETNVKCIECKEDQEK